MGISDTISRFTGISLTRRPDEQKREDGMKNFGIVNSDEVVGSDQPLLSPYKAGALDLDIRVVYAPLTRCRAVGMSCHG